MPSDKIVGFRAYKNTTAGLKILGEVWSKDLPKDLERKVKIKTVKTEEQMKKIKQIQQELVAFRPQIALSATYQNINPFQQQFPDFLAAMKTGLLATQECEALRSLGEESEYNKTLHRFNETPARIPLANSNPSAPGLLNIPVEAPLQGEI